MFVNNNQKTETVKSEVSSRDLAETFKMFALKLNNIAMENKPELYLLLKP